MLLVKEVQAAPPVGLDHKVAQVLQAPQVTQAKQDQLVQLVQQEIREQLVLPDVPDLPDELVPAVRLGQLGRQAEKVPLARQEGQAQREALVIRAAPVPQELWVQPE